jgi:phosphoheptose isomerase
MDAAVGRGMDVILLTGKEPRCTSPEDYWYEINVPSLETAIIQEAHIKIIHLICMLIDYGLEKEKINE